MVNETLLVSRLTDATPPGRSSAPCDGTPSTSSDVMLVVPGSATMSLLGNVALKTRR
jgi:hypothetical protein